jgi:hypothetical protein
MLTITPGAGERLTSMLADAAPGIVVRIVFGFHGLSFQPSAVCPGDTTFLHAGRVVLTLDRHLSQALAEKTLHLRPTRDGEELDLR